MKLFTKIFSRKIYDLDEHIIGEGQFSKIYKIKGKSKLIAKVSRYGDLKDLKSDFDMAKLLRKNGISTPKYVGIVKVRLLNRKLDALVIEFIDDCILIKKENKYNYENLRARELFEKEIEKIERLNFKIEFYDLQGLYSKSEDKIYLIDFGEYGFRTVILHILNSIS